MGKVSLSSIILLGICSLAACFQPSRLVRNDFQLTKYCFNGKPTGLEKLISINGYYLFLQKYLNSERKSDTLDFKALFYRDGTFSYNFYPKPNITGSWGTYFIVGDTIKARFIEPPWGMSFDPGEEWFLIQNDATLKEIAFKYYTPITAIDVFEYKNSDKYNNTTSGRFIPYDSLPDPNLSWLKKRGWYWCNEKDYLLWKRKMKAEGKW